MQDEIMRRFLDGNVTDDEFCQCETLMQSMDAEAIETVGGEDSPPSGDSLMVSLRSIDIVNPTESEKSKLLTDRIEGLIAKQAIGREDLERILDPAVASDELGRIGKYRVMEFIAAGGMGLVFKAEDTALNRPVCIKVMHPALAMKPDARVRFERESRAAAQLRSERIVTLLDIGSQRELPFIVMQLLEGESLRSKLARVGKLSAETAIHYVRQVAEGLRHAHAFGIVHRDIKPDNIWITLENDVKLLDFGLARALDDPDHLTTSGGLLGTPNYMSPEQIQGQTLDARSDLFSVGIVLYEMLTGELPFHKNNLFSTMISIANDSVKLPPESCNLQIPSHLERLLVDLLQKTVDERVQSAAELIERLSESQRTDSAGERDFVGMQNPVQAVGRNAGRNRNNRSGWKVIAGAVLGVAATLMGVFLVDQQNKGTLVVRTDDPAVEIQIAKEKVTIKDPLTGRTYEIRIGETPLHGGVYQLEMSNEAGDLRFSSRTIAIRRGEKTIVDVELQPSSALATELPGPVGGVAPSPESKALMSVADRSYDPIARDKFRDVLTTLRSLPPKELEEATFGSQSKQLLPGVSKWSIIPSSSNESRTIAKNSDGSFVASGDGNYLLIKSGTGETKHCLPAAGPIVGVNFCELYPNLVAAMVYLPTSLDREVEEKKTSVARHSVPLRINTPPSYCIYIWRLDSGNAHLIHRFPASTWGMAWDGGYRLAYHRGEKLCMFRLDLGESFEIDGAQTETFQANAISPQGRFLATQSFSSGQAAVNLWDLHRGEFAFSVLDGTDPAWGEDLDQVAVRNGRTGNREIWSLEKRDKVQTIELPIATNPSPQSPERILASALEPTFKRLAWLTARGDLVIRNIHSNRQNAIRLPDVEMKLLESGALEWAGDGTLVVASTNQFRWSQSESEVHGVLTPVARNGTEPAKPKSPLQFTNVFGDLVGTPTLEWVDREAKGRKAKIAWGGQFNPSSFYAITDTWLQSFDLNSTEFPREALAHSFLGVDFGKRFGSYPYIPPTGNSSISPDGKFFIDAPFNSNQATDSGEKRNVLFLSSLTKSPANISLGLFQIDRPEQIVWQRGGPFVIVLESKSKSTRDAWPVYWLYDTQKLAWKDVADLIFPNKEIVQIIGYEGRFLFVLKNRECWFLDPNTLMTEESKYFTSHLSALTSGRFLTVSDTLYFVEEDDPTMRVTVDSIPVRRYHRMPKESSGNQAIQVVSAPYPNSLYFSADGQFILQDAPKVRGVTAPAVGVAYGVGYNVEDGDKYITRWSDDAVSCAETQDASGKPLSSSFRKKLYALKGVSQTQLQWHRTANTAFWNGGGRLHFFDAEKGELTVASSYLPSQQQVGVLSTDYGWIVGGDSRLFFLDPKGHYLGQLAFDPELTNNMPTNPRWILADGSTSSRCAQKGLFISMLKDSAFHTLPLEEFTRVYADASLPTFDDVPFLK